MPFAGLMPENGMISVGCSGAPDLLDQIWGCVGLLLFTPLLQSLEYIVNNRIVDPFNKVVICAFLLVRIRSASLFPPAGHGGEWMMRISALFFSPGGWRVGMLTNLGEENTLWRGFPP
jgi:hypothetical protein